MTFEKNIVLVTGASGFLGTHLVRHLSAQGETVRALYHSNPPGRDLADLPGVTWQRADLLDVFDVEQAMNGVKEIYHCAAIVSFRKKDKEKLLRFNVEATANVVNEALEQGVEKVVFASSVASLGRSKEGQPITEEEEWEESRHNSVYAESKHLAELEVWRGMAEGLKAAIINPGIILGEGNFEKGSARLVKVVYNEFPFYTAGINAWVDVWDVATVMYLLMKSDLSGERYIVSAGNFAYKDVFTRLAKAMGRKPPRYLAGKWLSGIVWRVSWLKSKITGKGTSLTRETANTAQRKAVYDNSRLLKALPGFGYTPFDHTLQRMAEAYIKQRTG